MTNKKYWLEKWKEMMCKEFYPTFCTFVPKSFGCDGCSYNADYNLINCEEAVDYLK